MTLPQLFAISAAAGFVLLVLLYNERHSPPPPAEWQEHKRGIRRKPR